MCRRENLSPATPSGLRQPKVAGAALVDFSWKVFNIDAQRVEWYLPPLNRPAQADQLADGNIQARVLGLIGKGVSVVGRRIHATESIAGEAHDARARMPAMPTAASKRTGPVAFTAGHHFSACGMSIEDLVKAASAPLSVILVGFQFAPDRPHVRGEDLPFAPAGRRLSGAPPRA